MALKSPWPAALPGPCSPSLGPDGAQVASPKQLLPGLKPLEIQYEVQINSALTFSRKKPSTFLPPLSLLARFSSVLASSHRSHPLLIPLSNLFGILRFIFIGPIPILLLLFLLFRSTHSSSTQALNLQTHFLLFGQCQTSISLLL